MFLTRFLLMPYPKHCLRSPNNQLLLEKESEYKWHDIEITRYDNHTILYKYINNQYL